MNHYKNKSAQTETDSIRLDKWLWAARFYKTRSLATEAIKGGKVHLNGQRVKPSHHVEVNHKVRIKKDAIEQTVIIKALSDKRGPASIAQTLYEETQDSIALREKTTQERKAMFAGMPQHTVRRPSKKDRRKIIRFKQEHQENG
ncbi:MAG: ribosome-associated heat shock protein Hsp15 [gamma proteobacterium symbiont of Bathyaustriella thionipta]|nr:ribosome-associated heat shock protein Hsp15 [gamma proteobacterium symbiont of Bathyaustriella thionipta]MCU7950553.1 ribosome-associated heat shock protein Hsp15 [gamma proteobacterium symbiont of Bathyaustriella thionipta]MCU7953028.1 ribosome-associated heat shock protein Hsp15 [gamma proteobacterium symbiont of Bathyaustriella thionipta]MCU7957061.1 ribosome-associated heat shock protein Hsp15 [gamma proteobacterium symbiont of Bathyaustriella thionipta]MCU7967023.1 ribosome-associated 